MASIRSKLVAAATRATLKKKLGASGSVTEERATLEKMSAMSARRKVGEKTVVGGVPGEWQIPKVSVGDRVILYLHGGGYAIGSPATHRDMVGGIADAAHARAFILDYRLGPEHPFPGAVEDAVAAYRGLLDLGTKPDHIVIAGDSAGGGLTVATLVSLKEQDVPLPAAGICISPWVDLTLSGKSMQTKADADPLLRPDALKWMGDLYLAGQDPKSPLASPLFADLTGLPPLLIHVGSEEVLLDDALRLNEKAKACGVNATLEVWDGMMHVWHLMAMVVPEGKAAIKDIGKYITTHSAA
ncbi:MAG: alpha/beta hydrolase fold domain-containing protein [Porticoccaceae bacterium]